MPSRAPSSATPEPAHLAELEVGPAYRFAEHAGRGEVIPASGAGVYTIWDDDGALVYVGVAGRNPSGKGLASRLRSHASGRRGGDQFCVYVADHYVLPGLSREQIEAIRDSRLSMDALVRERIQSAFSFRFVAVADYRAALALERAIKTGALKSRLPLLNPTATRATEAGTAG
jgi:hypothetical protein